MTALPEGSGNSRDSRIQWKAWRTSTSQLRLKVPRVLVKRARQRSGAGVEHERVRTVLLDQGSRHNGIGHVGDDRGDRAAELRVERVEQLGVAGHRNHPGALCVEC
jgi:hypothetical protein